MTNLLREPKAAMQSLKIAGLLTEGSWRVDRPKSEQAYLFTRHYYLLLIPWSTEMCQTRHLPSHMLSWVYLKPAVIHCHALSIVKILVKRFLMYLAAYFTVHPYSLIRTQLHLPIRDCDTVYICLTICPSASTTKL